MHYFYSVGEKESSSLKKGECTDKEKINLKSYLQFKS